MKLTSSVVLVWPSIVVLATCTNAAEEAGNHPRHLGATKGGKASVLREDNQYWARLLQDQGNSVAPLPTPSPLNPTPAPVTEPTPAPTRPPTEAPTPVPTIRPTIFPTVMPSQSPSVAPTPNPTPAPVASPTPEPGIPTAPPVEPTPAPPVEPTPAPVPVPTTMAPTAQQQPNLCGNLNVSVSVGPGSSPTGAFVNVPTAQSLANVIDCLDVNDGEEHNQQSHVWWNPAPLELVFDFLGAEYELTSIHFWNYFEEGFDVDQIDFTFFDSSNTRTGTLTVFPRLGENTQGQNDNTIIAETFFLPTPVKTATLSALLTSSNGELDFQNLVFTAVP